MKLRGETFGERKKDWYRKRKIDQRNQAAFAAASMAINDAMSHYLNEMGTDRFDLLDVSIAMGAVMERQDVHELPRLRAGDVPRRRGHPEGGEEVTL